MIGPLDPAPAQAARSRSCGSCTLCCHLPEIDSLDKPANVPCRHCILERGCAIYADRPALCRDFFCLWMAGEPLGDHWQPSVAHMMIYRQGPQVTVLADPDHPDLWKAEPYGGDLRAMARRADESGGYVVVFAGDAVFKVRPDRP